MARSSQNTQKPTHGEIVRNGPNAGWVYLEFNKKALYVAANNSRGGRLDDKQADELAAKAQAQVPTDEQMRYILSREVRNLPGLKGTLKTDWYRTSTLHPVWGNTVGYRRSEGNDLRRWDDMDAKAFLRLIRN